MNCEFEKMPHEMVLSQTIAHSGSKWDPYKHCLIGQTNEMLPSIYRHCLQFIPYNCTQIAGTAMESHCHWYKYQAEISSGYESVWEYMEKPKNLNPSLDRFMKQAFSRYVNCIHSPEVTSAVNYCIPRIKEQCQSSSIIAAKILRVNIWNLDVILEGHPDWKVVHQIRDPRGVLISQRSSGIMTTYSKGSIIAESSILCDKMLNDTRSLKLYNRTHQSQYMLVKYEDYADAPVQTAQKIYSHIGSEATSEVIEAIMELTHASHDSGAMDQRRKNSSATARKWTTKMTSIEKKWIDKSCSDFYKESGYREDVKLRSEFHRPNRFMDDPGHRNGRDWSQGNYAQSRIRNDDIAVHRVGINPKDEHQKSRYIRSFMDDLRSRNSPYRQHYKHEYRNIDNNIREHPPAFDSKTVSRNGVARTDNQQFRDYPRNSYSAFRFESKTDNGQIAVSRNSESRKYNQQFEDYPRNSNSDFRYKSKTDNAHGQVVSRNSASGTYNQQFRNYPRTLSRNSVPKTDNQHFRDNPGNSNSTFGFESKTNNGQIAVSRNSAPRTDN